jgi:hypothetical protein
MVRYVGALVMVLGLWPVFAEQQAPPAAAKEPPVRLEAGETLVPGECLTKEELTLMSRLKGLKRPTLGAERDGQGDDQPRFNPNYLLGTWNIEGTLPESPLGPAGDFVGAETVRYADHCTYESTAKIKRPDGAVTINSVTSMKGGPCAWSGRSATVAARAPQDGRDRGDAGGISRTIGAPRSR